ncbi:hypothetical protein FB451DRAFT_171994 [Mycena latifolia]|nr:hypothetical protein FB451DRAFT_171994 [Mycena latifolia]
MPPLSAVMPDNSDGSGVCICAKPAANRCAGCQTVSYCSKECQRRDWKTHKIKCQSATFQKTVIAQPRSAPKPVIGTLSELLQLANIGGDTSAHKRAAAFGLDAALIGGANADQAYRASGRSGDFWRLDVSMRDEWKARADRHNRNAHRFWTDYMTPIRCALIDIDMDGCR